MAGSAVSISGKYLVKDGRSSSPPVTPWSYPKSLVIVSHTTTVYPPEDNTIIQEVEAPKGTYRQIEGSTSPTKEFRNLKHGVQMAQMAKIEKSTEDRESTGIGGNGLYSIHSPDPSPDRQMRYSEKGTYPWCIGKAKIWGKKACVRGGDRVCHRCRIWGRLLRHTLAG
jgi:hypothetical protein